MRGGGYFIGLQRQSWPPGTDCGWAPNWIIQCRLQGQPPGHCAGPVVGSRVQWGGRPFPVSTQRAGAGGRGEASSCRRERARLDTEQKLCEESALCTQDRASHIVGAQSSFGKEYPGFLSWGAGCPPDLGSPNSSHSPQVTGTTSLTPAQCRRGWAFRMQFSEVCWQPLSTQHVSYLSCAFGELGREAGT